MTTAGSAVTVPAVALRSLLAGAGAVLLASVVAASPAGRTPLTSLVLGAALVGWVVASPGSPAPSGLLLLALVVVLDTGPAPWPLLLVQGAAMSAVHVLAAVCALTPVRARWELAALLPVLRRWLLAVTVSLPVVTLVAVGPTVGSAAGLDVAAGLLALAGVSGLLALARTRGR